MNGKDIFLLICAIILGILAISGWISTFIDLRDESNEWKEREEKIKRGEKVNWTDEDHYRYL